MEQVQRAKIIKRAAVLLGVYAAGVISGAFAIRYGIGDITTGNKEVNVVSTSCDNQKSDVPAALNQEDCDLRVDVSGAVLAPGVYCLKQNEVVRDAIAKAGSFNTDLYAYKYVAQKINLAEKLVDSEKIYVPFQDDVSCELKTVTSAVDTSTANTTQKNVASIGYKSAVCININTATIDELDVLTGVGVATAQKIIEGRPYNSIEDIMNVKGIGESTYEKIKNDICI